jgi:hypothetical protein
MAMKCPSCGAENPEGKIFCGDCGTGLPQPPPPVQPMQPMPIQPRQSWFKLNSKSLLVLAIVVALVLVSVGLVYTQPWSKVKVLVYNQDGHDLVRVAIYVDGVQKTVIDIAAGQGGIIGVWPVSSGSHTVGIDYFYSFEASALDDRIDWSVDTSVGPFYTKNVFAYIGAAEAAMQPNLVQDLSYHADSTDDIVTIWGNVYNYGTRDGFGTLTITISDSRGWSITDTIELGKVVKGGSVNVSRSYSWPYYYNGHYSYGAVTTSSYTLTQVLA